MSNGNSISEKSFPFSLVKISKGWVIYTSAWSATGPHPHWLTLLLPPLSSQGLSLQANMSQCLCISPHILLLQSALFGDSRNGKIILKL